MRRESCLKIKNLAKNSDYFKIKFYFNQTHLQTATFYYRLKLEDSNILNTQIYINRTNNLRTERVEKSIFWQIIVLIITSAYVEVFYVFKLNKKLMWFFFAVNLTLILNINHILVHFCYCYIFKLCSKYLRIYIFTVLSRLPRFIQYIQT